MCVWFHLILVVLEVLGFVGVFFYYLYQSSICRGKWSFDKDNRKKLPQNLKLPKQPKSSETKHTKHLKNFVEEKFKKQLLNSHIKKQSKATQKRMKSSLKKSKRLLNNKSICLLYTSDAADD